MKDLPVGVLTTVTVVCSSLSLVGSLLVIASYRIARTKSKPKAAQLIFNLAVTDFFWFLATLLVSSFWFTGEGDSSSAVPTIICYSCTPIISFTRLASLVWTCVISFDVYMSVNRRRWNWKDEEDRWSRYRRWYVFIVLLVSMPGALTHTVKQHLEEGREDLGCSPNYEPMGSWQHLVFIQMLPIVLGFACNLTIYFLVRQRMSGKVYPQSVRKRRRQIMYYYMIACMWCWTPTILFYLMQLCFENSAWIEGFEVFARASILLTGFCNFLIFGMSDPHLRRSFAVVAFYLGLNSVVSVWLPVQSRPSPLSTRSLEERILKASDVEKSVMFQGNIPDSADKSSTKHESVRYRLSESEKIELYSTRPDLDFRRVPVTRKKPAGIQSDLPLLHEVLAGRPPNRDSAPNVLQQREEEEEEQRRELVEEQQPCLAVIPDSALRTALTPLDCGDSSSSDEDDDEDFELKSPL